MVASTYLAHKNGKVCCAPVNPTFAAVSAAGFTLSPLFPFSHMLLIIWFSKNLSFLGQVASRREVVETLTNGTGKSLELFQFCLVSAIEMTKWDGYVSTL